MRQDVYFLFPGKIHPPATTAHSIVATKLITERNCISFTVFPSTTSINLPTKRNGRSRSAECSNRERHTRRKIIAAV